MKLESDKATFSIDNLQPQTYNINIEFRYLTQEYGSITLVTANQPVTIAEGGINLTFNESLYVYPDNDGDKASNYYELRIGTNPVEKDKEAPITTAFPGGGDSGGYWGQQTVALQCSDQGPSGCDKTYYTTDNSDPKTSATRMEYSTTILIEETTTLKFYSVDKAGNAEITKEAEYIILNDDTPPVTTLDPPPGSYSEQPINITKDCTDSGGSGCSDMYYTTDGSDPKTSPTRIKYATRITITEDSILKFYSVDNAGNEEETQTAEYVITQTAAKSLPRSINLATRPYIAAEKYSINLSGDELMFTDFNPSNNLAYNLSDNKLSLYKITAEPLTPVFELGFEHYLPQSIALHPGNEFAYLLAKEHESGESVIKRYKIDPKTSAWQKIDPPLQLKDTGAKIIIANPVNNSLYLLSEESISSYDVNPKTGELAKSPNLQQLLTASPSAAVISRSGKDLYVRSKEAGTVERYAIDIKSATLDGPLEQIPVNESESLLIIDENFHLIDGAFRLD